MLHHLDFMLTFMLWLLRKSFMIFFIETMKTIGDSLQTYYDTNIDNDAPLHIPIDGIPKANFVLPRNGFK